MTSTSCDFGTFGAGELFHLWAAGRLTFVRFSWSREVVDSCATDLMVVKRLCAACAQQR
jgi:hypothetical protein